MVMSFLSKSIVAVWVAAAREKFFRSKMKMCWVTGRPVSALLRLIRNREASTILMVKLRKSSFPQLDNIPEEQEV